MQSVKQFVALAIIACVYLGCEEQASERDGASDRAAAPPYRIIKTKDVSFGSVRRLAFKVKLPEHYPQRAVVLIAETIVADATNSQKVNAISVLFYGPGTSIEGTYDIASIEWAPNGK